MGSRKPSAKLFSAQKFRSCEEHLLIRYIMTKAIWVLLIMASMVAGDKPSPVKKTPIGPETPEAPKAPVLRPHPPRHFRKLPFGGFRATPRFHKIVQKFPLHKALSGRKNRKLSLSKQKPNIRNRIQPKVQAGPKPVNKPLAKRPLKKEHNFARFLRAFGKQLNRPVLHQPRLKVPANNRRKFHIPKGKIHPIVFKKAEDIAGYEKFTLDEVIYPGAKSDDSEAKERSDDETDPIFVEDLEVDMVEKEEAKEEETKEKKAVDVDPRTKKLDVR